MTSSKFVANECLKNIVERSSFLKYSKTGWNISNLHGRKKSGLKYVKYPFHTDPDPGFAIFADPDLGLEYFQKIS